MLNNVDDLMGGWMEGIFREMDQRLSELEWISSVMDRYPSLFIGFAKQLRCKTIFLSTCDMRRVAPL